MNATIFNIQRFSIQDGPGIRTTVFMKGCPLRCKWCHNPESNRAVPELFYDPDKCVGCQSCAAVCERHSFDGGLHAFDRDSCRGCGKCAERCYTGALELCGKTMSADEVLHEVMKDIDFYTDGGGMTVSGGEPMMQFDFTLELLQKAKAAGLHICMETCGYAPPERIRAVAPYVDIFLFDYKETDPVRHQEFTGVTNELILSNLRLLDELGAATVLRCPIIPGCNDRPDHLAGIAAMAEELRHVIEVNVEPYHPLGKSKCERLGIDYAFPELGFAEADAAAAWIAAIQAGTSVTVKQA
ncbi:MAG: glycyl-radical enzyme activating protein [Clostridia bacterium]|nr:glycyl-radical enzyme activating protein [Clostridia bacterium]